MKNQLLNTRFLMAETDARRLPEAEAEVTFVGRSNVGKSSLICGLCEDKKLARVSKTPGRTRGLNIFEVRRGRWIVDLPGYGFADAPERQREYWPQMIGGYLTLRPNLKMIYVLIEAERGLMPIDISLIEWLNKGKTPFRIIGTKVDKLNHTQQIAGRAKLSESLTLPPDKIFWVSAQKTYGMKELRAAVASALNL